MRLEPDAVGRARMDAVSDRAGSLGHEGWGVVDAVGEGVSELQPGDRVGFLSGKAYAGNMTSPTMRAVVKLPDDAGRASIFRSSRSAAR